MLANDSFVGWGGLNNSDAQSILDDVVTVNNYSETLSGNFFSEKDYAYVPAQFLPTRANYPFGRCFSLHVDEEFRNQNFVSASIKIHYQPSLDVQVKVFFFDPVNDAYAIR